MSFYLYLPSNVSPQYYPSNRISSYKTKLPKRFNFASKEYEVALTEFTYVNSIKTFQQKQARKIELAVDIRLDHDIETLYLPDIYYSDIYMLLQTLNTLLNFEEIGQYAEFKLQNNRVTCNIMVGALIVNERLCNLLGFEVIAYDGVCVINTNMTAIRPPNLSPEMYHVFIYCDIIQPQIVGDTLCPLLRLSNLACNNDQAITQMFRPYYVPLSRLEFDTIEILLCNEFGEEIHFDKGQCIVTLHFRKIKNGDK
jgi:hypothetical protein